MRRKIIKYTKNNDFQIRATAYKNDYYYCQTDVKQMLWANYDTELEDGNFIILEVAEQVPNEKDPVTVETTFINISEVKKIMDFSARPNKQQFFDWIKNAVNVSIRQNKDFIKEFYSKDNMPTSAIIDMIEELKNQISVLEKNIENLEERKPQNKYNPNSKPYLYSLSADKMRYFADKKNYTLVELSKKINKSGNYLSSAFSNGREFKRAIAEKLAEILEVDLKELMN